MVLWGKDAPMLPGSTSRKAELTQLGCVCCPSTQGEPSVRHSCLISVPPLQGSMPNRCLRGSVSALWDPTIVLCRRCKLHKWNSENHDTKQSQPVRYLLSEYSTGSKAKQSSGYSDYHAVPWQDKKQKHVKVMCTHSSHCRHVLPAWAQKGHGGMRNSALPVSFPKLPCLLCSRKQDKQTKKSNKFQTTILLTPRDNVLQQSKPERIVARV